MTFLPITLTAHVTRLADYHLRQDSRRPAIPPIYRPISGPVAGGTTGGATGATAGGTVISAGDCKQADECLLWRVHRLLTFPPYSERNKLNFHSSDDTVCVSIDRHPQPSAKLEWLSPGLQV